MQSFFSNSINIIPQNTNDKIINTKMSPLKEIEQLQNDIKNALKNNIFLSKNGINNDINEHKSNNDNTNYTPDLINKKNKPFEKFNFN